MIPLFRLHSVALGGHLDLDKAGIAGCQKVGISIERGSCFEQVM